jgi:FHS family L-fucose permease-like MFS transporter
MAGGAIISTGGSIEGGFLTGRQLYYPVFLITLLFFLWGFSYGLLDVLNSHFQSVLSITKLQSTGLQVMYFGGGSVYSHPTQCLDTDPHQAISSSRLLLLRSSSVADIRLLF